MEADAYKLGNLDAALDFGLSKEAWAKAILPALGAATGALMAPEGEGTQGAILGGLGTFGVQTAALAGANKLHGAFPKKPAVAPIVPPPTGTTVLPKGAPVPTNAIPTSIHNTAQQHNVDPHELYSRRMQQVAQRPPPPVVTQATMDASKHFGTDPAMVTAMMNAPGPMKGAPQRLAPVPQRDPNLPPPPPPEALLPNDGVPTAGQPAPKAKEKDKGRKKKAALDNFKMSVDVSTGVGIPGLSGVSLGIKDQRERLPGMSRWVPRSTVERGFDYADQGLDEEAVSELEANRGNIAHPLLGAALAAAGARKFAPNSGLMGPLLAGLLGAGAGTLHNQLTKDRRVEEGLEGLSGAQREREKFPIRRHPTQTANESTPLAVSRGSGDA